MAKYASKGEPRSQNASSVFKSCVDRLTDESSTHVAFRSAMLRSVGERDFSAQETAHQLLSLPLVSCSFNFVAVSLDGGRSLRRDEYSGKQVIKDSLLDHYASRSSLPNTNLLQYCSKYYLYQGKLQQHSSQVIVRTFPQLSSNPHGDHYGQYCKYQLIKFKPWHGRPSNAWGDLLDTDANYIQAYCSFLQTPTAANYISHFAHELDQAQHCLEANQKTDSEDEEQQQSEDCDDWMLLCRLNQHYSEADISQDDSVDWCEAARQYPSEVLRECPTWISRKRQEARDNPQSPWHRQLPAVDTRTLNTEQRAAYNIISIHYEQLNTGKNPPPLHMIVCGSAGTGKSYLISAISHVLGSTCVLTGTTGMAAFNICGQTLHSALQLPVRTSMYKDLQGQSLHRLQLKMHR